MPLSTNKILYLLGALVFTNCSLFVAYGERIYYAAADLGEILYEGKRIKTNSLASAIKKASPGDTVIVLPGTYGKYLEIEKVGDPEKPIHIKGVYPATVISCAPSTENDQQHGIKFTLAKGLLLSDLIVGECPNFAVTIKDSSFITLRNLQFKNTARAIQLQGNSTHHITVEHSSLEMNNCNGESTFINVRDAASDLAIKNNLTQCVSDPLIFTDETPHSSTYSGEAANVDIANNEFNASKNKVLSVKQDLQNLWVHHNNIYNAKLMFEFLPPFRSDALVYSNVAWSDGGESSVFRLGQLSPRAPGKSLQIFHNTWFSVDRLFEVPNKLSYLTHTNNIILFANAEKEAFLANVELGDGVKFDYDLSNQSFLPFKKKNKQAGHSLQGNVIFKDPSKGNFALEDSSPALDKGKVISLGDWKDTQIVGKAPDIGAYEVDERKKGPTLISGSK